MLFRHIFSFVCVCACVCVLQKKDIFSISLKLSVGVQSDSSGLVHPNKHPVAYVKSKAANFVVDIASVRSNKASQTCCSPTFLVTVKTRVTSSLLQKDLC